MSRLLRVLGRRCVEYSFTGNSGKNKRTFEPLLQYLKETECEATLVRNDDELWNHIEHGTFGNKVCVIIDESHHLRCSREGLEQLVVIVEKQRMFVFVFADNEYQSFDRENQRQIKNCSHDLSRKFLGYYPKTHTFTEVYRNTRKIVSFSQHAIEDTKPNFQDITMWKCKGWRRRLLHCHGNLWDNSPENGLVLYLHALLIITGPKQTLSTW